MIYVNELGPMAQGDRVVWLCVALNLVDRQANVRATSSPQESRRLVAEALPSGVPVQCCASLGEFGRARGWSVQPAPMDVRQLAAQTLVGMENQEALGMLAFTPTSDAWLRTSALFVLAQPWRKLPARTPISITFTKKGHAPTSRVATVGGAGVMPPSLLLLPDRAAWETLRFDSSEPVAFNDAILCGFDPHGTPVSEAIGLAYDTAFHPIVMRLRGKKPVPFAELELLELAAALGAVCSLAERDDALPVGRALVDDLEAHAVRLPAKSEIPS